MAPNKTPNKTPNKAANGTATEHHLQQYEPLWGEWHIDSLIGEGSFGRVYKILRRDSNNETHAAAVKLVSIPYDETEIRQMRNEGLSHGAIQDAMQALANDIINEITLMYELRGNRSIVSLEDYQIIEKPYTESTKQNASSTFDTTMPTSQWDILIRMELLTSLADYAAANPMSALEVVTMGIDLCQAIELCAQKNIIHRDIKPDNIFMSPQGDYKLGDFGIARQIERTMSGLSKKGTYTFMAPEVYKGEKYGASVDIYSLGIVMYTLLNKNRAPFLPRYPDRIMPSDRDRALIRRMKGEPIPDLMTEAGIISSQLNAIVLQACAYDRDDRFAAPAHMRESLEALRNQMISPTKAPPAKVRSKSLDPKPAPAGTSAVTPAVTPAGTPAGTPAVTPAGTPAGTPAVPESEIPSKKGGRFRKIITIAAATFVILITLGLVTYYTLPNLPDSLRRHQENKLELHSQEGQFSKILIPTPDEPPDEPDTEDDNPDEEDPEPQPNPLRIAPIAYNDEYRLEPYDALMDPETVKKALFVQGNFMDNDTLSPNWISTSDGVQNVVTSIRAADITITIPLPPNEAAKLETVNGGTAFVTSDGAFFYTPPAGFKPTGADSFQYQLKDGAGNLSNWASVTVHVPEPVTR
ncbi:MAG: protein kinase [Peptococcaceae bacterium]|nr:protein kinase [Peptococcaceae bacterium]